VSLADGDLLEGIFHVVENTRLTNHHAVLSGRAGSLAFSVRQARSRPKKTRMAQAVHPSALQIFYPARNYDCSGPQTWRIDNSTALPSNLRNRIEPLRNRAFFQLRQPARLDKQLYEYIGFLTRHKPGPAEILRAETSRTALENVHGSRWVRNWRGIVTEPDKSNERAQPWCTWPYCQWRLQEEEGQRRWHEG
jgi:hypothetical protein